MNSGSTGTSDKTSAEILDAAVGGSVPYAVITRDGSVWAVIPLAAANAEEAMFGYVMVSSSSVGQVTVIVDSNGDATMNETSFDGEPNQ